MIDRLVTAAPALIFAAALFAFAAWAIAWSIRDARRYDAYQQAIQSEIEADRIRRVEEFANQHGKEKPQP